MASRRIRSSSNVPRIINDTRIRAASLERYATPIPVQENEITIENLGYRAVEVDAINVGAVTSQKFDAGAWTPNGESVQRVPAPLTDTTYWTDVVDGEIELHREGVHAEEDIVNVSSSIRGISLTPSADSVARVFFTGRHRRPVSSALYCSWEGFSAQGGTSVTGIQYVASLGHTQISMGNVLGLVVGETATVTGAHYSVDISGRIVRTGSYTVVYVPYGHAIQSGEYVALTVTSGAVPPNVYRVMLASANYLFIEHSGASADYTTTGTITIPNAFDGVYTVLETPTSTTILVDAARTPVGGYDGVGSVDAGAVINTTGEIQPTAVRVVWWATDLLATNHRYLYPENNKVLKLESPVYTASAIVVDTGTATATLTLDTAHDMQVGELVNVSGLSGTVAADPLDGQWEITAVGTYTISWATTETSPTTSRSLVVGGSSAGRASLEVFDYSVYIELAPAFNGESLMSKMQVFEIVGSDPTKGAASSVSPNGLTLTNENTTGGASVQLSLTTDSETVLRVQSLNQALGAYQDTAAIYSDGTGSFELLKADVDVNLGGVDLVREYDTVGAELSAMSFLAATRNEEAYTGSLLNRMARGAIYHGHWDMPPSLAIPSSGGAVEYVWSTGSFVLEDSRTYQISALLGGLRVGTNAPVATYWSVRFSTTAPTSGNYPTVYHLSSAHSSTSTSPARTSRVGDMSGVFTASSSVTDVTGLAQTYTFTRLEGTGSVQTYTTAIPHGYVVGDIVTVTGLTGGGQSAYNISNARITAVTSTTKFSVAGSSTITYTTGLSGGTATVYDQTVLPAGVPIYWAFMMATTGAIGTSFNIQTEAEPSSTAVQSLVVADIGQAVSTRSTYLGTLTTNAPTTTTYTKTKTVTATETAYFDNYGRGSYGTSDPYANEYSLYQGDPGTASGTKKSAIEFPALGLPSGATITGMRLYLKNRHTYDGSCVVGIGAHATTELSTTLPTARPTPARTSRTFSSGEGAWITLPSSWYSEWAAGTSKGVLVGITNVSTNTYDSTLTNYGYFDGVGTGMTAPPKLEVTYTYTA